MNMTKFTKKNSECSPRCVHQHDLHPWDRAAGQRKDAADDTNTEESDADTGDANTNSHSPRPQSIFPAARLSLCPAACSAAHLETRLTLHTEHVGVGCDRWDNGTLEIFNNNTLRNYNNWTLGYWCTRKLNI